MCRNLFYLISFILVLGLALTNVVEAQDDQGLIGWWKMDEVSGTVAADSSGNGNDGTVVGGAQWVSGYIDGAIDFDGDDDYIDCGHDPVFNTAGEMTVATWLTVRSVPTAWASVVAKGEYSWRLSCENLQPMFHFGITIWSATNPSIAGGTAVGFNEWHHVAGTYDGANINVYLDGSLDGTIATTSPIGVNAANVLIGENPEAAGRNWDGMIDDVRIYNRALSQAELGELMPRQLKATLPNPADKSALTGVAGIELSWTAGETASRHHLYIGESYEDVANGTGDTDIGVLTETSYDGYNWEVGKTYYWRVAEVTSNGNVIHPGDVWSFTILPLVATEPIPDDGAIYVNTDIMLKWTAGAGSTQHHVYFNENEAAVSNRQAAADMGTVGDPNYSPGLLEYNKTYYWLVDEYDGTDTHLGDVWSFTTVGPTNGARGEYFNNTDLTGNPMLVRVDPKIDFNWGADSPGLGINADGFSVRWTTELEVPVDDTYTFYCTSDDNARLWVDGQLLVDNWDSDNAWAIEEQASIYLEAGWTTLRMEFFDAAGDAIAQLKWQSPTIPRQVVSPAVLSIPLRASTPKPSSGYEETETTPALEWTAGMRADQHDIYFGTDYDEVAQADVTTANIYRGRQDLDNTQYVPAGALDWNTTYYWRIDEVNDAESDSPWIGKVWSFTTGNFLVLEDFEDYSDYPPDEVWNTWIDGYDNPLNGSSAGYPSPDFVVGEHYLESMTVRSGLWSMPVFYDNSTAPISEVTRSFDSTDRNWTRDDVVKLTLFYRGDPNNVAEPMYLVAGNVVVTNDDPDAALATDWVRWDIPLQSLADQGVNLANVGSMSLGFGNKNNPTAGGGSGHVFFDDIRLYREE